MGSGSPVTQKEPLRAPRPIKGAIEPQADHPPQSLPLADEQRRQRRDIGRSVRVGRLAGLSRLIRHRGSHIRNCATMDNVHRVAEKICEPSASQPPRRSSLGSALSTSIEPCKPAGNTRQVGRQPSNSGCRARLVRSGPEQGRDPKQGTRNRTRNRHAASFVGVLSPPVTRAPQQGASRVLPDPRGIQSSTGRVQQGRS
jgi:hypothetical protein